MTNPFAITTGIDPEDAVSAKQLAPEAFRAETFRAVRDEDYRAYAERIPGVQQAGAKARWTGSWLSEFVTIDPAGAFSLSAELRSEVQRVPGLRAAGRARSFCPRSALSQPRSGDRNLRRSRRPMRDRCRSA